MERNFADMLRGEYSCTYNFLGSFGPGVLELGDLKVEKFCHAISGRILKYLSFLMNYTLLSRNESTRARNLHSFMAGMADTHG